MRSTFLSARWRANSGPWALLCSVVAFIYLFSLGPILITAAVSFNQTNRSFFPPRGFSLRWWERAFSPEWIDPLLFSLKLGSLLRFSARCSRCRSRLRCSGTASAAATPWWR